MSSRALTAKYRPQKFADVAGQNTIKAILSRACAEDKIAPAYLFSGTRGVGKTTLARIFAKALNCRKSPAAEPCNACDMCKSITLGTAVDVVEIDGASNRGIDDVRRLKEVVGYAPMDGRYKIFIIDEAHMLSREAFNALLKTLEEPPARVTFIMATTESHKFPATIISRCQHFVFKPLPELALAEHLSGILQKEGLQFDENAVRLIARRGAGSVRDSMSLLGQVLALGAEALSEENTRSVLGLAGQEAFVRMLEALKDGNTLEVSLILRELLDQGLDIGFFLRELVSLWRNLFMLRQSGKAATSVVPLPQKDVEMLLELAENFSLSHIHACWQMTIEGQRRVLGNLEPALALELLLLNLALLPQLLSLEDLSALGRSGKKPSSGGRGGNFGTQSGSSSSQGSTLSSPTSLRSGGYAGSQTQGHEVQPQEHNIQPQERNIQNFATQKIAETSQGSASLQNSTRPMQLNVPEPHQTAPMKLEQNVEPGAKAIPSISAELPKKQIFEQTNAEEPKNKLGSNSAPENPDAAYITPFDAESLADFANFSEEGDSEASFEEPISLTKVIALQPKWDDVIRLMETEAAPSWILDLVRKVEAFWQNGKLVLKPTDSFVGHQLKEHSSKKILDEALTTLCGILPLVEIQIPQHTYKHRDALKQEILAEEAVEIVMKTFDAQIIDFGQIYQ